MCIGYIKSLWDYDKVSADYRDEIKAKMFHKHKAIFFWEVASSFITWNFFFFFFQISTVHTGN